MLSKWKDISLIKKMSMVGFIAIGPICFADFLVAPSFKLPLVWMGGSGMKETASSSFKNTVSIGQSIAGAVVSGSTLKLRGGFIQPVDSNSITKPIDPGEDSQLCLDIPFGRVCVTIPAGAFSEALDMNLKYPSEFPSSISSVAKLNQTEAGASLTNDKSSVPSKPVKYTFTYNSDSINGLDEKFFTVACYLESANLWVPVKSNLNTETNTISAETTCGPLVSIMAIEPTTVLSKVKAYPNPVFPNRGDTTLYLINLPDDAFVNIYTVSGAWVDKLETPSNGLVTWDITNRQGEKVASGMYIFLIQHKSERKTLLIGVER